MFDLLNVKNFETLKFIVELLGPEAVKKLIPEAVNRLMTKLPSNVKIEDKAKFTAEVIELLDNVVDLVDVVDVE